MKQLVCEMCGGADLLKQDGVFVCQDCGCKYTVEEARKIMGIEGDGPQGNGGVIKNSQAENILKNADATFEDGNYKEAFSLYSQAMNIDPENAHAIVFRALSSAWQSSVRDCRITEINNAADRALKLKHEQVGDSKEYFQFAHKVLVQSSFVINAIAQMYISYYNKAMPTNYSFAGALATSGISQEVKQTLQNGTVICCVVSKSIADYVLRDVVCYEETFDELWNSLEIMIKNARVYRSNAKIAADNTLDGKLNEIAQKHQIANEIVAKKKREKEAKERAARHEAYWAEHAEEKKALEAEKAELEIKIQAMQNQVNEIHKKRNAETDRLRKERDKKLPEMIECDKQIGVINELEQQKKGLGLFKGKEKKEIQSRIEEEVKKLEELRKISYVASEKYKEGINKQIQDVLNYEKDVTDEYIGMRTRVEAIETELTKDR